ncbi:MAG TPA: MFS transporter [Chloroflexota bacterium]|nr:MFS transporter [Chloroflexota bacterium]
MAVLTAPRRFLPSVSRPNPVLAMISSAHGVTHMYTALLPLVYPYVIQQFGISYGELGLVVGVSSAIGGVIQLVFGIAGRHLSHKLLVGFGNIACGITVALMGLAGGFIPFSLMRILHSIAQGPQHPIGNSMIADRFSEQKRGSAMSIHVAGGNVGTVIVPLLGTFLIAQLGWRPALVVFSIPGLLIGAAIVATILDAKQPHELAGPRSSFKSDFGVLVRDPTIRVIFLASMVAAGGRGLGILLTYIPLYLANGLHLTPTLVGVLFTVLLVGSIVGPVAGGRLSDIIGRKRAIYIALAGSFVSTVALVASGHALAAVAASLALMGLFVYAEAPIAQTFLADVTPPERRDSMFGLYFAFTFATAAAYAAGVGALIDAFGFTAAFVVVALSYVATALIITPAREPRRAC